MVPVWEVTALCSYLNVLCLQNSCPVVSPYPLGTPGCAVLRHLPSTHCVPILLVTLEPTLLSPQTQTWDRFTGLPEVTKPAHSMTFTPNAMTSNLTELGSLRRPRMELGWERVGTGPL